MNQIYYIFLLFSILFLIERKAINILTSFVGIMISIALLLPTIKIKSILGESLEKIDGEYISYILILVQVSALTILFGFIIMLFPNLSHSGNIKEKKQKEKTYYNGLIISGLIFVILLISLILVIKREASKEWIINFEKFIISIITIPSEYQEVEFKNLSNYQKGNLPFYSIELNNNIHNDTSLLRKIGKSLYSFDGSIIKLILITIILLLAIISLFFIISST